MEDKHSHMSIHKQVKPLVKWAGGKGQLIEDISSNYPAELGKGITKYAEPFIGGGAVLFNILNTYSLDEIYISDVNRDLINLYTAVRDEPTPLIESLKILKNEYMSFTYEEQREYYSAKRERFNKIKITGYKKPSVEIASLFIFLNKTCFNGLYRVNSKGLFNVPMGRYKNPLICDEGNILNVSSKLQNAEIVYADYKKSIDFIDEKTFVYFDPPYRPLTETASFTSYTKDQFDDENQIELAEYVKELTEIGAKVMVSNSDPKNTNPDDNFFDDLYSDFYISRVNANRMINSKGSSRGKITELLITNYKTKS